MHVQNEKDTKLKLGDLSNFVTQYVKKSVLKTLRSTFRNGKSKRKTEKLVLVLSWARNENVDRIVRS